MIIGQGAAHILPTSAQQTSTQNGAVKTVNRPLKLLRNEAVSPAV
jgi:hypothetical protein